MTINIEQIEGLFKEGKLDEARALLTTALEGDLGEEEKGALLVSLAEMYARATTEANNIYASKLQEALAEIRSINTAKDSLESAEKVASLKADLA